VPVGVAESVLVVAKQVSDEEGETLALTGVMLVGTTTLNID
jgi:hypothetical protein